MQTTPVPKRRLLVRGKSDAMNIIGEVIGSLVAEKCSPSHNSLKPSRSARSDFSVSSARVSVNERAGGWTGIMNRPRRMFPPVCGHVNLVADDDRPSMMTPEWRSDQGASNNAAIPQHSLIPPGAWRSLLANGGNPMSVAELRPAEAPEKIPTAEELIGRARALA